MYKLNFEAIEKANINFHDIQNLLDDLRSYLFEINSYSFLFKDKIKFYALLIDVYFDAEDNFGPFGIFVCPDNIKHLIKVYSIDIATRAYNNIRSNYHDGLHIFRLIKCSAILNNTEKNNIQIKYQLNECYFEKIS